MKIFGKGFYSRFSAKFSTFKKKKKLFTWSFSKMPLFRYLSATSKLYTVAFFLNHFPLHKTVGRCKSNNMISWEKLSRDFQIVYHKFPIVVSFALTSHLPFQMMLKDNEVKIQQLISLESLLLIIMETQDFLPGHNLSIIIITVKFVLWIV